MTRNKRWFLMAAVALWLTAGAAAEAQQGLRLYVIDGGELVSNPASYELSDAEVVEASLAVASYLIVHPRGVLIWDTGAIADRERISSQSGVEQTIIRADGQERHVTLGRPLLEQLAEIGYQPGDVTHMAMSHYHWDHTANSNEFASATWLVRPIERDTMFSDAASGSARIVTYSKLETSPTVLITDDEHDVFGDGAVILKAAPGHTPGHQVLYLNLPRTGGVVLSGDLYHYPEERTLNRLPTFEFNKEQTVASRRELERFLDRKDAELWIQHDLSAHRRLKKSPEYYD